MSYSMPFSVTASSNPSWGCSGTSWCAAYALALRHPDESSSVCGWSDKAPLLDRSRCEEEDDLQLGVDWPSPAQCSAHILIVKGSRCDAVEEHDKISCGCIDAAPAVLREDEHPQA
eukprot:3609535-Prymnesium_polylepis.1